LPSVQHVCNDWDILPIAHGKLVRLRKRVSNGISRHLNFFYVCLEGLVKTKKKLSQNQGAQRYEAGKLPARNNAQFCGKVKPVSVTIAPI
jgi:hypothetical protein